MNKVTDRDDVPNVIQALASLNDRELEIGIFGSKGDERTEGQTSTINMLELAQILHEGCGPGKKCRIMVTDKMRGWFRANGFPLKASTKEIKIPARPWLDVSIPKGQAYSKTFLDGVFDEIARGPKVFSGKAKWEALGAALESMMQQDMVDLREPPNHPLTIKKKGSNNPLVDTGHLVGSVTHEVRRR